MIFVFPFLAISSIPKNTCRTLTHVSSGFAASAYALVQQQTTTALNTHRSETFLLRLLQSRFYRDKLHTLLRHTSFSFAKLRAKIRAVIE
jgi:hypothetical protein